MGDTGLFVACAGIENSDPRDFQASAMRSIRLNSSVEEVVAFPDKFSNRDFCFIECALLIECGCVHQNASIVGFWITSRF